jgi:rhodanese-related sulfurtransferase
MKKKLSDVFSIVLLLAVVFYFLYQKGYILANFEQLSVSEAYAQLHDGIDDEILLDVRTQEEYVSDGRIEGSVLIPLAQLQKNLIRLEAYKEKKIFVYCRSGNRSVNASRILGDNGFKAYNVSGGINEWKSEGLPHL